MITATGLAVTFVIYFVWLLFLAWLASLLIQSGSPAVRAALCVLAAVAIAWGISLGIEAATLPPGSRVIRTFEWIDTIVQIGAPLAVFLWEWRSFRRHWIADEDLGEVFE